MTIEQQLRLIELLWHRARMDAGRDPVKAAPLLAKLIRELGFKVVVL